MKNLYFLSKKKLLKIGYGYNESHMSSLTISIILKNNFFSTTIISIIICLLCNNINYNIRICFIFNFFFTHLFLRFRNFIVYRIKSDKDKKMTYANRPAEITYLA